MRHASKAAAAATLCLLPAAAALAGSWAAVARALDYSGGTPAPVVAATARGPAGAARTGGAAAPSTQGTGGTEYGVSKAKTPAARKAAPRRPSHPARRPTPKPNPKPKPTPVKPTAPAPPVASGSPPAGAPAPAQTASEGAVFPVAGPHSFGGPENRFGAPRTGYKHQGQDVLASEGLAVLAPLAGTITTTGYQAGGAGWYAAEHTLDGLDFFYAHCQAGSLAVSTGQAVRAGQALCKVGQTGDATAPHLHFEVWVGGWRAAGGYPIDPLPYLEAWEHAPAA
jgi:murein DD-endopeptidase MepM/ murein hydrolase activator NlpD